MRRASVIQAERAAAGRAWARYRTTRMSVRKAREWGEGCHLTMATGDGRRVGAHAIPTLVEALAVLWQQERALRREVSLLQERLGIHPLRCADGNPNETESAA